MERAVPSVLAQTVYDLELIVVGDHCTDDTENTVTRIGDRRIRFVNLPHRRPRYPDDPEIHWLAGPVVPANAGLGLCRGAWIARIDDDDHWTTDHLEQLLQVAEDGNQEFVSGAYRTVRDGRELVVKPSDLDPPIGGTQTWLYRSYLKCFRYNIDCWRKSHNRVNDLDLQDRMWRAGVRMGYTDRIVAHVLPRPGETTVGHDAYIRDVEGKAEHYRFRD
jgi:glycosyltransferase involved in cell wall biosynthesis